MLRWRSLNDSFQASSSNPWRHKLEAFGRLIRLTNQTGTLLLALPSLWTLFLASHGSPPLHLLVIFLLGAFVMRSAGVVVNDLADRSFDRQVQRTKTRPLASGDLTFSDAIVFLIFLLCCAVGLLMFLNSLAMLLSPIALLLAALYPFTKRFFHVPQFFLGLAFGWGVVMAWAAVRNSLDLPMWLLYGATIFWALAYDTIYALQDLEDDRRVGVKSSALFFGPSVWLAVGCFCLGMIGLLGIAGVLMQLNGFYYGVLAGTAGFFSQQVWVLRGEAISRGQAFSMFQHHIAAGFAILAGMWLGFF